MKVSYNWLKDYCEFDLQPQELADRLSGIGLCVDTYEPVGDDWMLDVEVTTNRPDCLSHIGIAREIAAMTGGRVKHPEIAAAEAEDLAFDDVSSVKVRCRDLCPHYTARVITGVRVGPSPEWLRNRLVTCGVRPVNNVVDVTNYVLLETGQPLHAFDMALLAGRKIVVRRPRKGEKIVTIDETEHELARDMCVIADESKPVAVAGVMGGAESEIGDSTTDVLLESARFDPRSIRLASRAIGLSSDSSYRFERGVDPEGVVNASLRACQLILELAGGRLAKGMGEARADKWRARTVTLRHARLALVLGIEIEPDEVTRIFEGLELGIKKQTRTRISVLAPSWRGDLTREIDLIEEVARIHGYDKISETTRMSVVMSPLSQRQRCERVVRRVLSGAGLNEVMTYSLVAEAPVQRAQPWCDAEPLKLRNPVSVDKTHLRLTNMANLLAVKRFNAAHGADKVDVFELGKIYLPRADSSDGLPREQVCLGLLTDREDGFFVLKGLLANLLDALHVEIELEEGFAAAGGQVVGLFARDESLMLGLGGKLLGCVGVVRDNVAEDFDLKSRPALMEIDFDLLVQHSRHAAPVRAVPRYPAVQRDIAVVLDEGVQWKELRLCVLDGAPEHLESLEFFDVYRGEQIAAGKKSIAFSITLRSADRTLTGEEADAARDHIVSLLKERFDAELRQA